MKTTKGFCGVVLMTFLLFVGIGADLVSPRDPLAQDLRARLTEPGGVSAKDGSTLRGRPTAKAPKYATPMIAARIADGGAPAISVYDTIISSGQIRYNW